MDKITVLDIPSQFSGISGVIHPVVLQDERHMALIDCPYIGYLPALEQAMQEKRLHCGSLTHVLISHHDHDHMGALYALKQKYPHIEVVAGEKEAPYISGEKESLRLRQAQAMQQTLPEDQQAFGRAFCELLRSVQTVPVDRTVKEGDILDWCGGCMILETPGHTPGHISAYLKKHNILIAGDAAALENGSLVIANPQFTLDFAAAEKSLNRILRYGAKEIICYHGGVFVPEQ